MRTSVSRRSPVTRQSAGGRSSIARTASLVQRDGLPTIASHDTPVQASTAAITDAASGWPPPGTGQKRSPLVAKKRAPARMASKAACSFG